MIEELETLLSREGLTVYNLYEVYSLVFDLNESLIEQGEFMKLFPQNNKLGAALGVSEKLTEVDFSGTTSSFSSEDYSSVQSVFLNHIEANFK